MRELTAVELQFVSGAAGTCSNSYGGVTRPRSFGQDLIDFYEGLVAATSHVIERVARAL